MTYDELKSMVPKKAEFDWEEIFLGDIVSDTELDRLNACRDLPALAFQNYDHRKTWQAFKGCQTYEELLDAGMSYLAKGSSGWKFITARNALYLSALGVMGFEKIDEWKELLPRKYGTQQQSIGEYRLDLSHPPDRPKPIFSIGEIPIALNGDITTILAPAKSGKSAFIGAIVAAAAQVGVPEARDIGGDFLGITANERPERSIVVWMDTEQSTADAFDLAARAARRAKLSQLPNWIEFFATAGVTPGDLRTMIRRRLRDCADKGVKVWFIVIDGVADLCNDPNDLPESQDLVREIHGHARAMDCPVIGIVHRNEGQAADPSARGHLGKQLARKSAVNLTLEKDADEVTVVFSTKNRGAPILKDFGPRFAWNEDAKMHMTLGSKVTLRDDEKINDLKRVTFEVFGSDTLRYFEACEKIEKVRRVKSKTAEKLFTTMRKANMIREHGMGYWVKNV